MDSTYASIAADYDLEAMRDKLNTVCGTGKGISLAELQEIRQLVERLAHIQGKQKHLDSWLRFANSDGAEWLAQH